MEKDWPKRPPDRQLQEAGKKTLIGPQLLQHRQSVSLHTWCCWGTHKPRRCATFMLNSYWDRTAIGKKSLAHRLASVVSDYCDPVDCGLPDFSVRKGGSKGKNTGTYWPILVAIPF